MATRYHHFHHFARATVANRVAHLLLRQDRCTLIVDALVLQERAKSHLVQNLCDELDLLVPARRLHPSKTE